jgi:hypothetical protein
VVSIGTTPPTSWVFQPLLFIFDPDNSLYFSITNAGAIQCWKKVAASYTQIGSDVSYTLPNHKYLAIRESGGTIYFEASPDLNTWTEIASGANPFAVTDLVLTIQVGCDGIEATTATGIVDNLNVMPGSGQIPTIRLRPAIFTPGRAR